MTTRIPGPVICGGAVFPPTIRFAPLFDDAQLPVAQTRGAAGFDLHVHAFGGKGVTRCMDPCVLEPGDQVVAWAGFAVAFPEGSVGLVCSRSGLVRFGLVVLGAPGIIDADYRGEVGAPLVNLGRERLTLSVGDRVAQLVVVPYVSGFARVAYEDLGMTDRGSGGFGSTGL